MEYKIYDRSADQGRIARADEARKKWQRHVIVQFETAIQDVTRRLEVLEALASEEHTKSAVSDPNNVAYPAFAKALLERRENLRSTLASLMRQLAQARRAS